MARQVHAIMGSRAEKRDRRRLRAAEGVGAPCDAVDASADFDADECMPFLLPLTSVRRAVCSGTQRYSYQGGENLM